MENKIGKMENKYEKIAKELIQCVGGSENILSATHCATRLRLIVKDRNIINDENVEKVDQVKGVFFTSGQYQIILGTGIVNKVYSEIQKLGISTSTKEEQKEMVDKNSNPLKRLMRILADVFIPIIPILGATGLFLGLKGVLFNDNVLAMFGSSTANIPPYLLTLVAVLTETAFAFLPAVICWSAFKTFGGMPIIGLILGLMLVSPALPNAYAVANPNSGVKAIMAFGFIPLVGYQGSVLTALITGILGAKLEKRLRKIMPDVLDLMFTPFFVLLIMMIVSLLILGPALHIVELGLVSVIQSLVHLPFGIGGFMIGLTYPLAVLTGLHHTYIMIETSLLATTGFNPLITLCAMYAFSNAGTCLGITVKAKKRSAKVTGVSAVLSQLLGISEPALFGVVMRYSLKPMYIMLMVSGISGALLSLFNVKSNSYGLGGIPSLLMYIYDWKQFLLYAAIAAFALILSFTLTWMFAVPEEVMKADK
ncbi:PTS beta-glucoside transporter subunit EIIBCA [Clostridium polyendosporum]|uniref:PTS beta-glucoside transporter subunit EIIBCA n=1 Tax=Clostridium polyendosporum TaxID=69208 RepID=A0A919S1A6_9CLOT|nr:PTS transporter subunit EIIC [Clostridium polyendosporum]GIM30425.1 PTS beta-glucoside transporter subunit EIIBCA [Clostridium polyendosporum]